MLEKITRISKSRALDEVHLKLRQPLSKHSQRTDLPQDFKKLVLDLRIWCSERAAYEIWKCVRQPAAPKKMSDNEN